MQLKISTLLKNQLTKVPPVTVTDLRGKTVVVFGANTGLGFEAAKHFSNMNAEKVIIACRSREKGEAAISRIKEETGYSNTHLRILDLAEFSSVIEFVNKFQREEDRLDILVANAAVASFDYKATNDGWEQTLQVNDLSTLLATILLLPVMLKTAKRTSSEPRIVIVGSGLQYWAKLDRKILDSPNPLRAYSNKEYCNKEVMSRRYAESKARRLATVLSGTPIVANNVDPGYCYSELRRDAGCVNMIIFRAMEIALARTTEEGSRQLVWAALSENKNNSLRGSYIDSMKVVEPSDWSVSEEGLSAEEIFWDNMIEELSKVDGRVSDILQGLPN